MMAVVRVAQLAREQRRVHRQALLAPRRRQQTLRFRAEHAGRDLGSNGLCQAWQREVGSSRQASGREQRKAHSQDSRAELALLTHVDVALLSEGLAIPVAVDRLLLADELHRVCAPQLERDARRRLYATIPIS